MQEIQGTPLGIKAQTTKTGKNVWYVQWSDGQEYSTFEASFVQQVQGLIGQQAVLGIEQKGQFVNAREIRPLTMGVPGFQQTPVAAQGASVAPQGIPMPEPQQTPQERNTAIQRQSAHKSAFEFIGLLYQGTGSEYLAEAVGHARRLTEELSTYPSTGLFSGININGGASPAEVAAIINQAAELGGAVQVGAAPGPSNDPSGQIPWLPTF